MNKWEYMRIQSNIDAVKSVDETVDQLGRDGWELVSVVCTTNHINFVSYIHMWFKRPLR